MSIKNYQLFCEAITEEEKEELRQKEKRATDDWDDWDDEDYEDYIKHKKSGRPGRHGGRYRRKPEGETQFYRMDDDIKSVFDDITDLGDAYHVDYDCKWSLLFVTITLDKSLFQDLYRRSESHDKFIKNSMKRIDKFCNDEIVYRLERIQDLFGVKTHPVSYEDHENRMMGGITNKEVIHVFPGWENVYVSQSEPGQNDYDPLEKDSFQVTMYFGSLQRKLPIGVKANNHGFDKEGRYITKT